MRKTILLLCLMGMSLIITAGNIGYEISAGYYMFPGLHWSFSEYSGGIEAGIYNRINNRFEGGFGVGYNYAYAEYYDSIIAHNHYVSLFIDGRINIYEDFGIFKGENSFRTIYISPRAWHKVTSDAIEFYPGISLGIGFSNKMEKFTWGTKIVYHMVYSNNEYVSSSIVGYSVFISF